MKQPLYLTLITFTSLLPHRETLLVQRLPVPSLNTINKPAYDAFTRKRQPLSSENLWNEVKTFVKSNQGVLITDDTVLGKPYSQKNDLITYLWSNKEKKVVKGVGLMNLLWTDGKSYIPCDFRVYDKLGRREKSAF